MSVCLIIFDVKSESHVMSIKGFVWALPDTNNITINQAVFCTLSQIAHYKQFACSYNLGFLGTF